MTQVISVLRKGVIHHLSDRRLTMPADGSVHDERSNKTVAVVLPRSIGVVGYTGTSRIGMALTDDWLAAAICADPAAGPPEVGWTGLGRMTPGLVRARIVGHLERHLHSLTAAQRRSLVLYVQYVGHYERRRRLTPFIFEVFTSRNSELVETAFRRDAGEWIVGEHVVYSPTPPKNEVLAHAEALKQARDSERDVWNANVNAMRSAAMRPTVGSAFIGLRMQPRHQPVIDLTFFGHGEALDTAPVGILTSEVVYLPWILTPTAFMQPTVCSMSEVWIGSVGVSVGGLPRASVPFAGIAVPQNRRPSTGEHGQLPETELSRRLRHGQMLDAQLARALAAHQVSTSSGGAGESEVSYCATGLPAPGTAAAKALIADLDRLPFRVLLYDTQSGRTITSGCWTDEEHLNRSAEMRSAAELAAAAQATFDLSADLQRSLEVETVRDLSRCERDATLIRSLAVPQRTALANLRVKVALQRICALADTQLTVLRISDDVAERHAAENPPGLSAWTFEDLGFERTAQIAEPYRRSPIDRGGDSQNGSAEGA